MLRTPGDAEPCVVGIDVGSGRLHFDAAAPPQKASVFVWDGSGGVQGDEQEQKEEEEEEKEWWKRW